jgi:hypothetical protein
VMFQSNVSPSALQIESEATYSGRDSCLAPARSDTHQMYGVTELTPTEPDQTAQATFHLILHDYYTVEHPRGDGSAYRAITLSPQLTFGPADNRRYVAGVTVASVGDPAVPTPKFAAQ